VFTRLLEWIRGAFKRMIGQSSIKERLNVDVALSSAMTSALETWSLMYQNQASWLSKDVKSLNLAAAIAGEIARAVTIEMKVEISGSPRADYLKMQFETVLGRLREKVEAGAAKGGLMMKPYVDGQNVTVDFIQADQFYPVSFDSNGNITGCIFADQRQMGDKFYTRLEYHQMTAAGYEVTNQAYKSDSQNTLGQPVPLAAVEAWAGLLPQATITGITKPLFAYFRFPLANNIDSASPLGVSCYSRAVDQIEQADRQYSRILWENESGERALYVDKLAFGKDDNNKPILPNKKLYRTLDGSSNIGDDALFEDWTPTIRIVELEAGLNLILKKIEFLCGLAFGTLCDPQSVEKTATEIAAAKQRSQATIVDTQKALEWALNHLLYAMDFYATVYRLAPLGTYQAVYEFDDSLIVDSEAQMVQDRQAVSMGAMPKWIFLMRNYGLTEEVAKQWIVDQQAEQPQDFFQGAGA
jgi:A118 family predicted phage portal protein